MSDDNLFPMKPEAYLKWKNKLICNDNLEELSKIEANSIDLVYIDPPFFSNRHYEVIWGDEAEVRSFEDRWEGGMNVYIEWMKQRVIEIQRVLKDTGSFYLHCDWHASHYLKVMCDDIFGYNKFRNEIVWCYSIGGKSNKTFGRKHDVIFWYTKTDEWKFNVNAPSVRVPRKPDSHMKVITDNQGNIWQEKIDRKTGKAYRYPLDKVVNDWWIGIEQLNREDKERLGYPTQKPVELLTRIVEATTDENDIVLDTFCGCGTSLEASQKLKRRWYGIDISPTAIKMVENRLKLCGVRIKDIDVIGMPKTIKDTQKLKPFEFQYWVINEMHGSPSPRKSGDMGIDGLSYVEHHPIQVKQSEGVGRNVVDNFETALKRYYGEKHKGTMQGYIIAYDFGHGAREEVSRAKKDGFEITLITVQDILDKKFTLKHTE